MARNPKQRHPRALKTTCKPQQRYSELCLKVEPMTTGFYRLPLLRQVLAEASIGYFLRPDRIQQTPNSQGRKEAL